MDIRDSLSRLKKKVKHRLSWTKQKPDTTDPNSGGERTDETDSLSRPVSRIVASGGHNRETDETNTDEQEIRSTGGPPQVVSVPMSVGGSENRQGGGEGGIDGEEPDQGHLHPRSHSRVTVGSGPRQQRTEVDREKNAGVYLSPSTPSVAHDGGPDCMWMFSIRLLPLIVPSDNTGTSTIPDHLPEALHPDKSVGLNAAVGNEKPDWKSTASSTAKLLLHLARDSADAFGPLKSVTGGLCAILQNFEVCPLCILCCLQHSQSLQQTKANNQAIESLAHRIEESTGTLCAPIHVGDTREESRRKILGR